jgi:hypothetical protein
MKVDVLRDDLDRRVAAGDLDRGRSFRNCAESLRISSEKVAEKSSVCRTGGHERDDPLDIRDEAHVEHAVGFIEDEDLHLAEVERLLPDEVEEASRRRDEDLDTPLELLDLRVDVDPAVDHERAQRHVLAVGLHAVVDLDRELARRREDQAAHRVQRGREALRRERREPLQKGKVKPAVLPVPVCAAPRRSRPERTTGMACAWMGVGSV